MEKISFCRKLHHQFGVVSIGGPLSGAREELALNTINKLGYSTYFKYPASKYYADYTYGFTNGSQSMRLDSITQCLNNEDVDCLLAGRGSAGSLEIINMLPYDLWKSKGKILIGESDVTSILVQMPFRCNIPAIHGSTLGASFADYESSTTAKESIDALIKMLTDVEYRQQYQASSIIKESSVSQGFLLAGNMSMLVSLLGTEFDIDYAGSILVLEEVGEAPFRVKRMLTQLKLAGKFKKLKGLCFGRFSKCEAKAGPSVEDVINEFCTKDLQEYDFPILCGLEVGHWGKNLPVPIGCQAQIKGSLLVQIQSPIS